MKVKICGLTHLEDAQAAVAAGADMLGFNFYPASPRYVSPKECARLVAALGGSRSAVSLVGIFVDATIEQIEGIMAECELDLAQLCGNESAEILAGMGQRAVKALRPTSLPALLEMERKYPPRAIPPAYLVDAYQPGLFGGTGQTGDWSLAANLSARAPVLLAGGLTPDNVLSAIRQVKPWGVDVASGVERSPGRKDPLRVARFISIAKHAESHDL